MMQQREMDKSADCLQTNFSFTEENTFYPFQTLTQFLDGLFILTPTIRANKPENRKDIARNAHEPNQATPEEIKSIFKSGKSNLYKMLPNHGTYSRSSAHYPGSDKCKMVYPGETWGRRG